MEITCFLVLRCCNNFIMRCFILLLKKLMKNSNNIQHIQDKKKKILGKN